LRSPFRLLVAPIQAVQESSNMVSMVSNTKVTLDDFCNALGRPQVGAVSPRQRTLQQNTNEFLLLLRREFRRTTGRRLRYQTFLSFGSHCFLPPLHGTGMATELSRHRI